MHLALHPNAVSVEQKIRLIRRGIDIGLKDPQMILLARRVTEPCKSRDDVCDASAIFWWAKANVKYQYDPKDLDVFDTARRVVEARSTDCDGFTVLICTLAQHVGFPVGARVTSQDGKVWNHIYPLVGLPRDGAQPREWMPLDPTVPGLMPGQEIPPGMRKKQQDFRFA